jgi:tetratricopeptide (TPR) repeat protein
MTPARRAFITSTSLVLLVLAATADAQPTPPETPTAIARRHFDQGEAYFKAGAFDLAAAKYQAAYDAVPEPVLLFNAGLAWENHGDAAKAITSYDAYLVIAPDGGKAAEARARRDVLARRLEDERAAADRAAADRAAADRAEQERVAAERAAAEREAATRAGEQTSRPSLVPAIAAYSVGAAALGVGIVYGLRARSIGDELEADLDTGPPVDTSDPRFDDGHDAALIADVAFVVAGAATAVGAYFTYRAMRRRPAPVTVAPAVGDNHVGATIGVRW